MSENLEWCPKSAAVNLPFTGTSYARTREAMEAVFGSFPIQLNMFEHEIVLKAMAQMIHVENSPYHVLLTALRKFGEIEVRECP